jgi:hypothetical protein
MFKMSFSRRLQWMYRAAAVPSAHRSTPLNTVPASLANLRQNFAPICQRQFVKKATVWSLLKRLMNLVWPLGGCMDLLGKRTP